MPDDGFVYGGTPSEGVSIATVKPLADQMMLLTFSSGETRLFDATILSGPVFEPLKNPDIFMHPTVEHGVVVWADGDIDCAPEYMYKHSFEYSQVS